jgi:hypothetical protein
MTPVELAERCFEIPARVERVVHLAVIGGVDMDIDMFEWLIEDGRSALIGAFGTDPETFDAALMELGEREDTQREALASALVHKPVLGWLVEVSTPIKRQATAGCTFSWGSYRSKVFYAEEYAAALEAGLTWAEGLEPEPAR